MDTVIQWTKNVYFFLVCSFFILLYCFILFLYITTIYVHVFPFRFSSFCSKSWTHDNEAQMMVYYHLGHKYSFFVNWLSFFLTVRFSLYQHHHHHHCDTWQPERFVMHLCHEPLVYFKKFYFTNVTAKNRERFPSTNCWSLFTYLYQHVWIFKSISLFFYRRMLWQLCIHIILDFSMSKHCI